MYEQHLTQAGLTREQAALYEALVHGGPMQASSAARKAKIPRTFVYAVLSGLKTLGLVESRKEKGSITTFSASHPFKLQELARNNLRKAEQSKASVEGALAAIISDFNKMSGQPGIRIMEGVEGIEELYADILRERQPISLIRSPNDASFPELAALVEKQKSDQARIGIVARVLTSKRHANLKDKLAEDKKIGIVRRVIRDENFKPPAQIIIYGKKISITAYRDAIITTIIENKDIHTAFALIFEYMWTAAYDSHIRLLSKPANYPEN